MVNRRLFRPGFPDLKGAMMFVGPNGKYGRHQTPTDLNNFGPRFGFAYHVLPAARPHFRKLCIAANE